MANIPFNSCGLLFGEKVSNIVCRMTDCTSLNPTVSIPYQIISAIIKGNLTTALNFWVLLVPSSIGAVFAGYFMLHIY
jgi:hypothetical protein